MPLPPDPRRQILARPISAVNNLLHRRIKSLDAPDNLQGNAVPQNHSQTRQLKKVWCEVYALDVDMNRAVERWSSIALFSGSRVCRPAVTK